MLKLVVDCYQTSPEIDEIIALHGPLEQFLAQSKEEATNFEEGYQGLEAILAAVATEN